MTKAILLSFCFLFLPGFLSAQTASDSLMQVGNKFYRAKEFDKAGQLWIKGAEWADNKVSKQTNYYYASNAFAKALDSTNSFRCLELAIVKNGFIDLPALQNDDSYNFMHGSPRWGNLLKAIKPVYTKDPSQVTVIDKDVKHFWQAYDKVQKSPKRANDIYKQNYIDKGSMGLQYYYVNKINSMNSFVYVHTARQKYYKSIRATTLKAGQLKAEYQKSFVKLKQLYPQAIFPPIYFVIGKLNSAGTVCSYGLILAIDQASWSPAADTTELNTWEKHNISSFNELPHTVAHELIHYLQDGMASDTTLLRASLVEGMADFIGELISGKTANERLKLFAKGKEKKIWESFKKEMYLNRAENWIANSEQETADKPADLGYWVGYEICKSYYEQTKDKQRAISDMLHIQDYRKFFIESKFDQKGNTW